MHIYMHIYIYTYIHIYIYTYIHIPSYTIIYHHIPLYTIIYHHIPSYTIIYHHIAQIHGQWHPSGTWNSRESCPSYNSLTRRFAHPAPASASSGLRRGTGRRPWVAWEASWRTMPGLFIIWLVIWNINFIFPYIGNNHPDWLSYFSEGFKPPTSHGSLLHPVMVGQIW